MEICKGTTPQKKLKKCPIRSTTEFILEVKTTTGKMVLDSSKFCSSV